jgi:hypothetical protein
MMMTGQRTLAEQRLGQFYTVGFVELDVHQDEIGLAFAEKLNASAAPAA